MGERRGEAHDEEEGETNGEIGSTRRRVSEVGEVCRVLRCPCVCADLWVGMIDVGESVDVFQSLAD
jgi:hypothetical protein